MNNLLTQADIERGMKVGHTLRARAFIAAVATLGRGLRNSARALVAVFF